MIFAVKLLTLTQKNMKLIYLLFTLFILTSCIKNEDPIHEDPILNIGSTEWYLERINDTGGSVHLKIVGSTNGDKVTVRTFGDGLISDKSLELNSENSLMKIL